MRSRERSGLRPVNFSNGEMVPSLECSSRFLTHVACVITYDQYSAPRSAEWSDQRSILLRSLCGLSVRELDRLASDPVSSKTEPLSSAIAANSKDFPSDLS